MKIRASKKQLIESANLGASYWKFLVYYCHEVVDLTSSELELHTELAFLLFEYM